MIGTKEIYKVGKGKIITIDQENIEGFEVSLIETLKRECKKKLVNIKNYSTVYQLLVMTFINK